MIQRKEKKQELVTKKPKGDRVSRRNSLTMQRGKINSEEGPLQLAFEICVICAATIGQNESEGHDCKLSLYRLLPVNERRQRETRKEKNMLCLFNIIKAQGKHRPWEMYLKREGLE